MNRKISVIGLGYVGLPVAAAFGKITQVIGIDINPRRIEELSEGRDWTGEVKTTDLKSADIFFTTNPDDLKRADFHIVTVPTPIDTAKRPNLTPLLQASDTVGRILKKDDIVVYESTVYPGCTEEDCVPLLEGRSGLKLEVDFGVGYSPERINPGDRKHTFSKITKIVSGSSLETTNIVAEVYASVVNAGIHKVSSIKVAEAAKVIENAQRDLNIAFTNELAMLFNHLNIDTNEVLEAAGTKWNFLPFRPGLVGGHCVGVDPYYLTHKAEQAGYNPQVILSGRRINDGIGSFVAQQTVQTMAAAEIGSAGALVSVFGLTFKEDCPDLRNSQVPNIIAELKRYGCNVQVHDPCCDPLEAEFEYGIQLCTEKELKPADALVLAVAHHQYHEWSVESWQSLLKQGGVVSDVKNVVPSVKLKHCGHRVWRL